MVVARFFRGISGYLVAIALTSVTTLVVVILNRHASIPNVSLLYLPVVLFTAVYFGTWSSLTAATLAALEYDFFLLPPAFTLTIVQAPDVLAFLIFVIVAVLTSQLAAGARSRAEAAQRRARESETLYELGRSLMSTYDVGEVLQTITERIVDVFRVSLCAVFVPLPDGGLQLAAESVRGQGQRDRASESSAAMVFENGAEVNLPTDGTPGDVGLRVYVPLRTADLVLGVLEVGPKLSGGVLDAEERRLVTSFAAQAALLIARAQAEEQQQRLRVLEDSDRLKSALLSSVSHDLRTPLASIKASATALLLTDADLTAEDTRELLRTIDHEADRLNRLVGNLLDLSRIEAGVLRPVLDWYDLQEVLDTVLPRLRSILGGRPLQVDVQPGTPLLHLDLVRIDELLSNLVENAVRYAPGDCPLTLSFSHDSTGLHVRVADHGPGIPEQQRTQIFDAFYRLQQHSDRDPGAGLGLAICRGIAEAHGGSIHIEETRGGGATFVLTLPPSTLEQRVSV